MKTVQLSTLISTEFVPSVYLERMITHSYSYNFGQEDSNIKIVSVYIKPNMSHIVFGRILQLQQFVEETDADYLINIDADQTWSVNGISDLISSGKDIIGAPVRYKRAPYLWNVFDINSEGTFNRETIEDELFECDGIGFGMIAISKRAATTIWNTKERKSFEMPRINSKNNLFFGEDLAFCINARQLGFSIYCEPKVKTRHYAYVGIGENIYD
jgi:hypothetical protein